MERHTLWSDIFLPLPFPPSDSKPTLAEAEGKSFAAENRNTRDKGDFRKIPLERSWEDIFVQFSKLLSSTQRS